jgi:hypothetical protein
MIRAVLSRSASRTPTSVIHVPHSAGCDCGNLRHGADDGRHADAAPQARRGRALPAGRVRSTERVLPGRVPEHGLRTATMAAHFAYGAAMSSLVAVAPGAAAPIAGAGYGLLIWAGSYLGWLPSMHILKSAVRHPAQRNAPMGAVHLVWGAGTSVPLRELLRAQSEVFFAGFFEDLEGGRWQGSPLPPRRIRRNGS